MAYFRFATGYRPGGPNFVGQDPVTGEPLGNARVRVGQAEELRRRHQGEHERSAVQRRRRPVPHRLGQHAGRQPTRNGVGVIANADTARSTGAELTLTALPVPDAHPGRHLRLHRCRAHGGCSGPGGQGWRSLAGYAGLRWHDFRRLRLRRRRAREHGRCHGAVRVGDRVSGFDAGQSTRSTTCRATRPSTFAGRSPSAPPTAPVSSATCSTSGDSCPPTRCCPSRSADPRRSASCSRARIGMSIDVNF